MQVDTKTLVECVNRCFALASSASIPAAERKIYLAAGERLRARLVTLLHANFTEGTANIQQANSQLRVVNKTLRDRLQSLQNTANTVRALGDLVSIIDDLFKLPFTFV